MARFNRAQKIIIWRAKNIPLSFAEIGAEFGVKGERAGKIFKTTIEDAWRFANGMPPRKGLAKRIDHMAICARDEPAGEVVGVRDEEGSRKVAR